MINQQLDQPLGPRLLSVDVKIIFLGTPPVKPQIASQLRSYFYHVKRLCKSHFMHQLNCHIEVLVW